MDQLIEILPEIGLGLLIFLTTVNQISAEKLRRRKLSNQEQELEAKERKELLVRIQTQSKHIKQQTKIISELRKVIDKQTAIIKQLKPIVAKVPILEAQLKEMKADRIRLRKRITYLETSLKQYHKVLKAHKLIQSNDKTEK